MRNYIYVITDSVGNLSLHKALPRSYYQRARKIYSGAQLWYYLRPYILGYGDLILQREGSNDIRLRDYCYMDAVRDFTRLRPADARQLKLKFRQIL